MIQVIHRAANILRALEGQPSGLSLAEIADEVDLPRSTVHRIVKALQDEGLVESVSAKGGIRLGFGLMRLSFTSEKWLAEHVHQHLRSLSHAINETVDLSIRSGDHVCFIDQISVQHRLQAVSGIGVNLPLHCTAPGKILLAQLSDIEIYDCVGKRPQQFTNNTIVSVAALKKELVVVRRNKVAYDREEHQLGICAVGTLLNNPFGVPAAISIPVPTDRFVGREKKLGTALLKARAVMERSLVDAMN